MRQLEDDKTLDAFGFPLSEWIEVRKPQPLALVRATPPGIVPGGNYRERERVKRKAARWMARLNSLPADELAYIRTALGTTDDTAINGDVAHVETTPVAVLFARSDSVYKTLPGCDVWDFQRDAKCWPGGAPIVAHPPCRSWGSLSHFAKPRPGEKQLALWAVEQVRRYGGVLEHPKRSKLWAAAKLPAPGQGFDQWGGWSIEIQQYWFGHKAEKKTLLYIVGCETPPPLPLRAGRASHVVASGVRNQDGSRPVKGDPLWRPEVSEAEREHTPATLACWLVDLARRCKPHGGA